MRKQPERENSWRGRQKREATIDVRWEVSRQRQVPVTSVTLADIRDYFWGI